MSEVVSMHGKKNRQGFSWQAYHCVPLTWQRSFAGIATSLASGRREEGPCLL